MVKSTTRNPLLIAVAFLGTGPAAVLIVLRLTSGYHVEPLTGSVLYGLGILSSAFLLSWAAEAIEHDISHGLALALVAIITVLPEYAVDFTLVWKAGEDPAYASYAVANMTGANRLLIGIAWPLVLAIVWLKALRRVSVRRDSDMDSDEPSGFLTRYAPPLVSAVPWLGHVTHGHGHVDLHRGQAIELGFLGAATVYAFTIPLKGQIDLLDAVVLISMFAAYMWFSSRSEVVEPELVGPAALIGSLSRRARRIVVGCFFVFAAVIIFQSAEPFAEGLIRTGISLGIEEFLLIQWLAPLASEAPEIVVACIFAIRGDSASALGLMISAKVNQWTLLVGSLPVVYSFSVGTPSALQLDPRQTSEVLLTAAQSLFAVVLLAPLFLRPRGAFALFILFITQLTAQVFIPFGSTRYLFSATYMIATVLILLFSPLRRRAIVSLPGRAYRRGFDASGHAEYGDDAADASTAQPGGH